MDMVQLAADLAEKYSGDGFDVSAMNVINADGETPDGIFVVFNGADLPDPVPEEIQAFIDNDEEAEWEKDSEDDVWMVSILVPDATESSKSLLSQVMENRSAFKFDRTKQNPPVFGRPEPKLNEQTLDEGTIQLAKKEATYLFNLMGSKLSTAGEAQMKKVVTKLGFAMEDVIAIQDKLNTIANVDIEA